MFVEGIQGSERGWGPEDPRPQPPSVEDSGRSSEDSAAWFLACRPLLMLSALPGSSFPHAPHPGEVH